MFNYTSKNLVACFNSRSSQILSDLDACGYTSLPTPLRQQEGKRWRLSTGEWRGKEVSCKKPPKSTFTMPRTFHTWHAGRWYRKCIWMSRQWSRVVLVVNERPCLSLCKAKDTMCAKLRDFLTATHLQSRKPRTTDSVHRSRPSRRLSIHVGIAHNVAAFPWVIKYWYLIRAVIDVHAMRN